MMPKNFLAAALLALTACSSASTQGEPSGDEKTKIMTVKIGPELLDCFGMVPMKCLVVDGTLFYDQISGFTHKAGVTTLAEIERHQYCDPDILNSCPQDVGIYRYKLLKIISETR